jgi:hypothetical protein
VSSWKSAVWDDPFISYRKKDPDESWVQEELRPALERAGLRVLIDVNDFVPGRNVIEEIDRAGRESRRALCIVSPDYFDGDRLIHFESLQSRFRDPRGADSGLIPLILRETELPGWLRDLVPVDWTPRGDPAREWRRLLQVLEAKDLNGLPPQTLAPSLKPKQGAEVGQPVEVESEKAIPRPRLARGLLVLIFLALMIEVGLIGVMDFKGSHIFNWRPVSLTDLQQGVAFSIPVVILLLMWPIHLWMNRRSFTRERFALASVSVIGSMIFLAFLSILAETAPWEVFSSTISQLLASPRPPGRVGGWGMITLIFMPLGT